MFIKLSLDVVSGAGSACLKGRIAQVDQHVLVNIGQIRYILSYGHFTRLSFGDRDPVDVCESQEQIMLMIRKAGGGV